MLDFLTFLQTHSYILGPGGMGTELQRRGYETKLPLWSAGANLEAPELVTQIHKDYLEAGADLCTTNTFRTTKRTYKKLGYPEKARESLAAAVLCARRAADTVLHRPVFVAGSFAPLEDCYRPDLVPDDSLAEEEHEEQVSWLVEEGVDFLLPETINSLREAKIMARVASESGLPFIISFVVDEKGHLLDGSSLALAVEQTAFKGRVGVSINCRTIDSLSSALPFLSEAYEGLKGVYANGIGRPDDDLGWIFEDNQDCVEKYARAAALWKEKGARFIGGCCGTTPAYIAALKKVFDISSSSSSD